MEVRRSRRKAARPERRTKVPMTEPRTTPRIGNLWGWEDGSALEEEEDDDELDSELEAVVLDAAAIGSIERA